jgi:hypothetical protein
VLPRRLLPERLLRHPKTNDFLDVVPESPSAQHPFHGLPNPRGPPDLILRSGRIFWVSWGESGGPRGPGKAFKNVGADGPHIFEGPRGPPDPPRETQKIRPDLKIRSGGPLGVKNMNLLNWESLVPEVPRILGGLGVGGVGRFLINLGAFGGSPIDPYRTF